MRGGSESRIGARVIAAPPRKGDVAGRLGPDLGRTRRHGGLKIRHSRQGIDIENDLLGCILRRRAGLGYHEGDGLADVMDTIERQRMTLRDHRRPALVIFQG